MHTVVNGKSKRRHRGCDLQKRQLASLRARMHFFMDARLGENSGCVSTDSPAVRPREHYESSANSRTRRRTRILNAGETQPRALSTVTKLTRASYRRA